MLDRYRRTDVGAEGIELVGECAHPRIQAFLQRRPLRLHVLQHGVGRSQRQWVAHEGAGEIGDADGGDRIIAELPLAAIEGVHELAFAGDHADRIAAADHLAVGAQIGLDAEMALRPRRVRTETSDYLVEDAQRAGFLGDTTQFSQEFRWLEIRAPTLHRLHQHRGKLVRVLADELQRFGGAVIEHDHVLGGVAQDAGRRRHGTQLLGAAHDHLVDDAVVGAIEQHHRFAAGDGARDAQRAEHRLRAGIAQRRAIVAGDLAYTPRYLARQRMLRADLVTQFELLAYRIEHEIGLPAEQAHAEAVEGIDVIVAVQIPQVRALGTFDHDLVDDLLGQRAEAVDHARIGHVRAVRLGVLLGLGGARGVTGDEGIEALALVIVEIELAGGIDAGDGTECLLDVVTGVRERRFLVDRRCRRGDAGGCSGRHRRNRWHPHGGRGGAGTGQQGQLLRHQLHLLIDHGTQVVGRNGCVHGADSRRLRGGNSRRCGLRHNTGRSGSRGNGFGWHLRIEHGGQMIEGGRLAHQLPERDLQRKGFLQLQRDLRQHQAVEPEFDEVRLRVGIAHVETGHVLEHLAQLREQARLAIGADSGCGVGCCR